MKQSHTIYSKQWADYFDYLDVDVVLPEIMMGKMFISDRPYKAACVNNKLNNYYFNGETFIGFRKNAGSWGFNFVILGFGVKVLRQWSY